MKVCNVRWNPDDPLDPLDFACGKTATHAVRALPKPGDEPGQFFEPSIPVCDYHMEMAKKWNNTEVRKMSS